MKRDDELVKRLLLEMEESTDALHFYGPDDSGTEEEWRVYYHLKLMQDAGFVEESGRHGGDFRMTNAGHDFAGMLSDAGLWSQMKSKAAEVVPAYGLRLLFEIGHGIVRQRLRDLGLPLD